MKRFFIDVTVTGERELFWTSFLDMVFNVHGDFEFLLEPFSVDLKSSEHWILLDMIESQQDYQEFMNDILDEIMCKPILIKLIKEYKYALNNWFRLYTKKTGQRKIVIKSVFFELK